jgi:hypothetical protein
MKRIAHSLVIVASVAAIAALTPSTSGQTGQDAAPVWVFNRLR